MSGSGCLRWSWAATGGTATTVSLSIMRPRRGVAASRRTNWCCTCACWFKVIMKLTLGSSQVELPDPDAAESDWQESAIPILTKWLRSFGGNVNFGENRRNWTCTTFRTDGTIELPQGYATVNLWRKAELLFSFLYPPQIRSSSSILQPLKS
jgi:hypothetical protein